jgi:hypothetical protein
MRSEIVGAVLAVLIVASLGTGYLVGTGNRQTSTLTSLSTLVSIDTSTLTSISTSTVKTSQTIVSTTTTVSTATSTSIWETPIPITSIETGAISIGGSPSKIAVNPNASRIYVVGGTNIMTVINAVSHSIVARVTLPATANDGIAVDSKSGIVYVLVQGGVAEINGTTNMVVGEFPLNFGWGALVYDSATHVIYGSKGSNLAGTLNTTGNLIGADVRTGSIVANISLGYWANSLALNQRTHMVFAVGCAMSFVCGSEMSLLNGTSKTLVKTVHLGSASYATVTVDPTTNLVYVASSAELIALSGISGTILFDSYTQTCDPFLSMTVIPSSNQILAVPDGYNYVLVYNRSFGNLVNMYSLPGNPYYLAFNPNTNEAYAIVSESMLSFQSATSLGHVNGTLIGSDQTCLPV